MPLNVFNLSSKPLIEIAINAGCTDAELKKCLLCSNGKRIFYVFIVALKAFNEISVQDFAKGTLTEFMTVQNAHSFDSAPWCQM